jgi:D-3-phosphoglycerate dehydrogenase / 2-oxoglutarate reductase
LGNIPQKIVPKAQAFGIEVIASDPYAPDEVFSRLGVRRVEFDELLATSDFVSVHAPLTPETTGMFNAAAFGRMKSNALLVNTARGPLVTSRTSPMRWRRARSPEPPSTCSRSSHRRRAATHRP